jgi:hypothetical protein
VLVKARYAKSKGNHEMMGSFLCDWLQDKTWGHMINVISWEKQWSEENASKEQWMIPAQIESFFKSADFASKIMQHITSKGSDYVRDHPDVPDVKQFLVNIEESKVVKDKRIQKIQQSLETNCDNQPDDFTKNVFGEIGDAGGARALEGRISKSVVTSGVMWSKAFQKWCDKIPEKGCTSNVEKIQEVLKSGVCVLNLALDSVEVCNLRCQSASGTDLVQNMKAALMPQLSEMCKKGEKVKARIQASLASECESMEDIIETLNNCQLILGDFALVLVV